MSLERFSILSMTKKKIDIVGCNFFEFKMQTAVKMDGVYMRCRASYIATSRSG